MKTYLDLMQKILEEGVDRPDRTGTGTRSLFGVQMRFDLAEGFPLLTTKKLHFKAIAYELLWFLAGQTNIRSLQAQGIHIWDAWADAEGELGPVYGAQWRAWPDGRGGHIDQMQEVVQRLKTDPFSRRLVVSSWNPAQIKEMALPPCHMLFQFYVAENRLSCHLTQRSADFFLGVPFNIASYALLTEMLAQICALKPGYFIHSIGDAHLYTNHFEQAQLQLMRTPRLLPRLVLNPEVRDLFSFRYEDFLIENYTPHPSIKAQIAV